MDQPLDLRLTTFRYPVPDFIYQSIQSFVTTSNSYHSQPSPLLNRLAQIHQVTSEHIFLTAGIDEAIKLLSLKYGQQTTIFPPCYIEYQSPSAFGHQVQHVFSMTDDSYHLVAKSYPQTTLFIIANPNNPFGVTSPDTLVQLAAQNPHALVVVDEAYSQFAPELTVASHLQTYPNLVVLRSFSKGYGLAGVRIGYILAQPSIISALKDKVQWDNVSYLAVGAAMAALEHEEYYREFRQQIIDTKTQFENFLTSHQYKLLPSLINATVIKFSSAESATQFTQQLAAHQILVNQGSGESNLGLDSSFVRIAIGTQSEMAQVQSVISAIRLPDNIKSMT